MTPTPHGLSVAPATGLGDRRGQRPTGYPSHRRQYERMIDLEEFGERRPYRHPPSLAHGHEREGVRRGHRFHPERQPAGTAKERQGLRRRRAPPDRRPDRPRGRRLG